MLGHNKVTNFDFQPTIKSCNQTAISLSSKFHNVNKTLGPEMKSAGESILLGEGLGPV